MNRANPHGSEDQRPTEMSFGPGPGPGDARPADTQEFRTGGAAPGGAAPVDPADAHFPQEPIAGRYRLVERIGEGGMGEVWIAEQTEPIERRVALKLIKAGLDSRQVLARFEAERQALAVMDHPHIARILDGGRTDAGQPFFVMELVDGVHITAHCDRNRLLVRQRLELFVQVCHALQHAHQKGTIHRDVKPSNVLVSEVDGQPLVKVIDFGLARAVDRRHDLGAACTEFGAVVGTPEYMSPEQADMSNQDIDTRTDIYSLGVLLFELVTGTTPLALSGRRGRSLLDTLRDIREADTPTPSVALFRLGPTASAVASLRSTPHTKLARQVRGELDWILMKCLENDRARRYDTAAGLASDIQRHLNGEVVEACPPTTAYRLRSYLRRHKVLVTTGSLVLFSLIAGIVGTTSAMVEANRQRQAAEVATARVVEANFRRLTEERRQVLESGIADAVESLLAVAAAFDT